MPDSWSDFDDRWRVDDDRDRRRRERRDEQRRRTRRRRFVAIFAIVLVAGFGVFLATSNGGSPSSEHALAPVSTEGADGKADTVAKTTTTTATTPAKPLTRQQKQVAIEDAEVATFAKHRWFITQGGKRKREIALTFDDGPGPFTERIMRVLRSTNTPATFFQIGSQIPTWSNVVKKQIREGFVLGDHTEGHVALAGKPRAVQHQQISDMQAQMTKLGGPTPVLFRPPTGVWDRTTRQLLKRKGMVAVFWTIDTDDWQRPGTDRIVQEVMNNAKPGAIVLMHDAGGDRTQTLAALPSIIKGLRKAGYKLVTIPQLLKDAPPKKKKPAPFGQGAGL